MHDRLAAAESRRAALLQNMEALAQVLEDGEKGGERRQLERSLRGVSEALGALQAALTPMDKNFEEKMGEFEEWVKKKLP